MRFHACVLAFAALLFASSAKAETGYDLWLRYVPVEAQYKKHYAVSALVTGASSATLDVARA